jgi:hypothetical protein
VRGSSNAASASPTTSPHRRLAHVPADDVRGVDAGGVHPRPSARAAAGRRVGFDGEAVGDEVVADLVHGGPRQPGGGHQRAALARPVHEEGVEHGLAVAAAQIRCRAHLDRLPVTPAE